MWQLDDKNSSKVLARNRNWRGSSYIPHNFPKFVWGFLRQLLGVKRWFSNYFSHKNLDLLALSQVPTHRTFYWKATNEIKWIDHSCNIRNIVFSDKSSPFNLEVVDEVISGPKERLVKFYLFWSIFTTVDSSYSELPSDRENWFTITGVHYT